MFFSTMVEPSEVNPSRSVELFGSGDGAEWRSLAAWEKDRWSMKFFQYGNAFLPDGENTTDLLAVSTIAVAGRGFSDVDLEDSMLSSQRLHYYRRIFRAYLTPGESQLSFWHDSAEMNPSGAVCMRWANTT